MAAKPRDFLSKSSQMEVYMSTAKRFFDLDDNDIHQPKKLLCTQAEKITPDPIQNLGAQTQPTFEQSGSFALDETCLAELFLNHLNQENQNLRKILAFHLTSADQSKD